MREYKVFIEWADGGKEYATAATRTNDLPGSVLLMASRLNFLAF
jgi:hypothetical protein